MIFQILRVFHIKNQGKYYGRKGMFYRLSAVLKQMAPSTVSSIITDGVPYAYYPLFALDCRSVSCSTGSL